MAEQNPSAIMQAAQPLPMASSGDVLQKVAVALYAELERQLQHNRKRTADLRHKHMLQYTTWARRKLSALLAVLVWCNQENTGDFISAVEAIKMENSSVQSRFNEMLDALFKLHSELYSKLVRPLPVAHARDIIAHGTYPTLPKAIFTRGVVPPPEPLPDDEANPELMLAIQAKLLLLEQWVAGKYRVEFLDGRVVIVRDYLFSLSLSMPSRALTSPWEVMEFKIRVTSCVDELQVSDITKRGLEMRTLNKLDRIAKALDGQPALQTMLKLCEHVAQSALLNLLYCQSLSVSATSHAGALEASFFQDVAGYRTVIHLWPRERIFMLGVKLFMAREVGSPLQGILFCPAAESGVELFGLSDQQLRELNTSIVNEDWTTRQGLSVARLIDLVTSVAVSQRAAMLAMVLQQAASKQLHPIVNIEHTDTRIVVRVGRASVTIEVSCMTGEYTAVPSCGSFEDIGGFRGVLRRFVSEINELSVSSRDHAGAVSMFAKLVSSLLLAHWAEVLAAVLMLQPHENKGWERLLFPGNLQPSFTCQFDGLTTTDGTTSFLLGVLVNDDVSVHFTAACASSPNTLLQRPIVLHQHELSQLNPLRGGNDAIQLSDQFAILLRESLQQFPHVCAQKIPVKLFEKDREEVVVQVLQQKNGNGSVTVLSSVAHPDRSVLVRPDTNAFVLLRTTAVTPEYRSLIARIEDLQNGAFVCFPCQSARYATDVSANGSEVMWRVRGRFAPMALSRELRRRAKWLLSLHDNELQESAAAAGGEYIAGIPSVTIQFQQFDCPFKQLTFVALPGMATDADSIRRAPELRLILPDGSDLQCLRHPLEAAANDAFQLSQSQDLASVVEVLGNILFVTALMYSQSRRGVWKLQDAQLLSLDEQTFLVSIGSSTTSLHTQYRNLSGDPALHFANTATDENRMLKPNAASTLQCLESVLHAKAATHERDLLQDNEYLLS